MAIASAAGRRSTSGVLIAVVQRAVAAFVEHDNLTLAAALAFYTLLSFAPLMVLTLWTTSTLGVATQNALLNELGILAGDNARIAAQAMIDSLRHRPPLGSTAGIVGIVIVLVGATSVFAQLQSSLNTIWDIPPRGANAVWAWVRRRIVSFGVVAGMGFVLIVSTLVSSALDLALASFGPLLEILNQAITLLIFSALFAFLFRFLPDARLPWRHAYAAGLASASLFGAGKWLIGIYLAHGNVGGAYGAAGSLVVLLVWVYYSSAVFFFSAELVRAWLTEHGGEAGALLPSTVRPVTRPGSLHPSASDLQTPPRAWIAPDRATSQPASQASSEKISGSGQEYTIQATDSKE